MLKLFRPNLPDGFSWDIAPNGQLSSVLTTSEENVLADAISRATDCGTVRNPFKCYDYNSLADEYGLALKDPNMTLEQFRQLLSTYVYTPYRTGSDTDMQKVLDDAGFVGVVVVKNNRRQDPRLFQGQNPIMVVGMDTACCGNDLAFIGMQGYEVLVNGPLFNKDGSPVAYDIGSNSDYWDYVDFICGGVEYDENEYITSISPIEIPQSQEDEFKRLILRTKPAHNWIVIAVTFVEDGIIAQTGDEEIPTIAMTGDEDDDIIAQTGV